MLNQLKSFTALALAVLASAPIASACPQVNRTVASAMAVLSSQAKAGRLPKALGYTAATPADAPTADAPSVVGLWEVVIKAGGEPIDMALMTYHSDGTEALTDVTSPTEGNFCMGIWQTRPDGKIQVKHTGFSFTPAGQLAARVSITEVLELNGNAMTGTYELKVSDLDGKTLAVVTGTLECKRVTFD